MISKQKTHLGSLRHAGDSWRVKGIMMPNLLPGGCKYSLNGLFQKKYTPRSPRDGKLENLAGGGVDSSGNPGGRGDLERKILPRGSLLTLTSIDIFQPLKKELCNGKSCSL